jgi:hypothetical protein
MWPNWMFTLFSGTLYLLWNKPRIKAIHRIGPHVKEVLSVLICGMLGDWWSDKVKGQIISSVRFNVEQGIPNVAYIHFLTNYFNDRGYTSYIVLKLIKKTMETRESWFNYRLTLYSFSSLN